MDWITITTNNTRSKKFYWQYFQFKWKKELQKNKLWLLLTPVSLITLLVIVFSKSEQKNALYYIPVVLICILFFYLPMAYLYSRAKYSKWINTVIQQSPPTFQFRFDEEGIHYESEKYNVSLKWVMLKYYATDKNNIYLFTEKRKIQDIISAEIIGPELFNTFKELTQQKISLKY